MFLVVLVTEVGKKSGRIIKIFDVVADMLFQILPTLQFMLLFYTFRSRGGQFIFNNHQFILLTVQINTFKHVNYSLESHYSQRLMLIMINLL